MGYDATNYLSPDISKKELADFIKSLGYSGKGTNYYFFKNDDYKYLCGVSLQISRTDNSIFVYTRTPIYCSFYDLEFQNSTIRKIKNNLVDISFLKTDEIGILLLEQITQLLLREDVMQLMNDFQIGLTNYFFF